MTEPTQGSAPPQLSPDGQWWWTGAEWVPASQAAPAAALPVPTPTPMATPMPGPSATPYPQWPAVGAGAPAATSGLAIAALVVAFIPGIGSIVAIVLGSIALSQIGRSGGRVKGRGLAIAGIVLGAAFFVVAVLAAIAIPTFLNQRHKGWDAAVHSELREAAIAEESYFSTSQVYTSDVDELVAEGWSRDPRVVVVALTTERGDDYCLQGAHEDRPQRWWYLGSRSAQASLSQAAACG